MRKKICHQLLLGEKNINLSVSGTTVILNIVMWSVCANHLQLQQHDLMGMREIFQITRARVSGRDNQKGIQVNQRKSKKKKKNNK